MLWHHSASNFDDRSRAINSGIQRGHRRIGLMYLALTLCLGCTVTDSPAPEETNQVRSAPLIAPPPGAPSAQQQAADHAARVLIDDDEERIEFREDDLGPASSSRKAEKERLLEGRARSTNAELTEMEGGIGSEFDAELGQLEGDLGLEPHESSKEKVPSLAVGVARIKSLYKKRRFDAGLIEVNRMLEFYPRSPQLLMMKGTLHQWLGHLDLALVSYRQAAMYRPGPKLAAQIRYLEMKIRERENMRGWAEGDVIPGGPESVETTYPGAVPEPKSPPAMVEP